MTDDELAQSLAVAMGITWTEARRSVAQMKAARRRERVLAEGLKRYRPRPVLKCDCDAAAGSEATGTKRCPRCDAHLPTTSFAVSRQNGLSSWCRSCVRGYRLERAGRGPLRAPRPRIADRARQQVAEMLAAGEHYRAITAATGVSVGSITRIRRGL